jgi:hypothetical protein
MEVYKIKETNSGSVREEREKGLSLQKLILKNYRRRRRATPRLASAVASDRHLLNPF